MLAGGIVACFARGDVVLRVVAKVGSRTFSMREMISADKSPGEPRSAVMALVLLLVSDVPRISSLYDIVVPCLVRSRLLVLVHELSVEVADEVVTAVESARFSFADVFHYAMHHF